MLGNPHVQFGGGESEKYHSQWQLVGFLSYITYIRLRQEFLYLSVLMDVFTRCIRGWHLGRSLDQSLTFRALEQALAHATPEIHHSDQGVQYAATAYTARLQVVGTQISMAEVGAAWQNGYAERLMRTIKEEEVELSDYQDYADAVRQVGRFLDEVYMRQQHSFSVRLPHSFRIRKAMEPGASLLHKWVWRESKVKRHGEQSTERQKQGQRVKWVGSSLVGSL